MQELGKAEFTALPIFVLTTREIRILCSFVLLYLHFIFDASRVVQYLVKESALQVQTLRRALLLLVQNLLLGLSKVLHRYPHSPLS